MTADTLGQRFKAWRRKHHYTLRGIGKRTGISASTLSRIEHGGTATHEHMTVIEALIGAAPPPPDDWRVVAILLDTENAKLAALVQSLQAELKSERAVCAWFEAAAFQAGDEARALRAIVDRFMAEAGERLWYNCDWCAFTQTTEGSGGNPFNHAANCPVTQARALLEGGAATADDRLDEWQSAVLAAANEAADAFAALDSDGSVEATQRDLAAERALLDLVTQRPATTDKEQA